LRFCGGLWVYPRGLGIKKLTNIQLIIVFHVSLWEVLGALSGGAKPPVVTGLVDLENRFTMMLPRKKSMKKPKNTMVK